MHSLRDKLIKAGLITEARAPEKSKGQPRASPEPDAEAQEKPAAGTKAQQRLTAQQQRLTAQQQRERDRRLRELATQAQVPIEQGDCAFHFVTRKGRIRRLELASAQVKKLEEGTLAIVERPEPAQIEHSLVPAATAEEMLRLSEASVRFYARQGAPIGCTTAAVDGSEDAG